MRILKQHPILRIVNDILIDLPAPINLSYMWNYGSLLGLILLVQMGTGIFLAMHYVSDIDYAFISVEHIMRDVNNGWLLRYIHANGASFFFILVYLHIGRGLYYGSYTKPREMVWGVGVIIFIVMMATAFLGYTLPWGGMSYWGSVVITNLISAIPYIGQDIVEWVWGGFSVGAATLNRFYSIHYTLPFVIAALVVVHIIALHENGSGNPTGLTGNIDKVPFHPYYSVKDIFGIGVLIIFMITVIYFAPNMLGHPDNYVPANPLVTPPHIQPEWYFLFAYAILRSIPNKLLGVIALFGSLLVLFILPYVHMSQIRSNQWRPINRVMFWFFVGNFGLLTYIGAMPVEEPWVIIGQISSGLYFLYFFGLIPLTGWLETQLIWNKKKNK